jgi:hypothetical protein
MGGILPKPPSGKWSDNAFFQQTFIKPIFPRWPDSGCGYDANRQSYRAEGGVPIPLHGNAGRTFTACAGFLPVLGTRPGLLARRRQGGVTGDGRAVELQLDVAVEVNAQGVIWLPPIGFLGRFGRKSSETLGFPGKWRKRPAESIEPSGKPGSNSKQIYRISGRGYSTSRKTAIWRRWHVATGGGSCSCRR